jgi:hypothetical protein
MSQQNSNARESAITTFTKVDKSICAFFYYTVQTASLLFKFSFFTDIKGYSIVVKNLIHIYSSFTWTKCGKYRNRTMAVSLTCRTLSSAGPFATSNIKQCFGYVYSKKTVRKKNRLLAV